MKADDLRGKKFGRLTAILPVPSKPTYGRKRRSWWCLCDCGEYLIVSRDGLFYNTKSCGCLYRDNIHKPKKHGHSGNSGGSRPSLTYSTWKSMKRRCLNPNNDNYKFYGGRGITICDEWKNDFRNFLRDMGERPKGTTINRIDNDGKYELGNCEWVTHSTQMKNRKGSFWDRRIRDKNGRWS